MIIFHPFTIPLFIHRVKKYSKFFGPNVFAEISKVDAGIISYWLMMMMM